MTSEHVVAVIGVGLIGGSIGLAVRRSDPSRRVIGIGRRTERLEVAQNLGAITEMTTDVEEGVAKADLVVVCTPVDFIPGYVVDAAAHARPATIITDAGSTKAAIVQSVARKLDALPADDAEAHLERPVFIGSHPLAGSEQAGPEAARVDLFDDRLVVVTPTEQTPADKLKRLTEFWKSLGARTMQLPAQEHDAVLAATSHVPHLVASALAAATAPQWLPLTAGGWRDCTRVAAGDPVLWQQILLDNRDYALKSLDEFAKKLAEFRRALSDQDPEALKALLQAGKARRDAVGS